MNWRGTLCRDLLRFSQHRTSIYLWRSVKYADFEFLSRENKTSRRKIENFDVFERKSIFSLHLLCDTQKTLSNNCPCLFVFRKQVSSQCSRSNVGNTFYGDWFSNHGCSMKIQGNVAHSKHESSTVYIAHHIARRNLDDEILRSSCYLQNNKNEIAEILQFFVPSKRLNDSCCIAQHDDDA